MLPIRLEMRNFLAYRAPDPIIFEGIDLACLTGQNGVGKSSILDALTWALWGRARAKRDEELIHLGQNDMRVALDFEQEGLRYRVLRRRSRSGRGRRGALDLMVWAEDDLPRIINEDGMRRTQEKINAILHLDYETFAHSAFLQQGRADAFTLKTAAERKRILADILSLEQWAVYEAAAKERLRALATQIDIIQHDMRGIDAEIAREPQLQAELAELLARLETTNEKLQHASAEHSLVANSAAALRREQENLLELKRLIKSRRADMQAAQAEIARQDKKIAEYQQRLAQEAEIEAVYQQLLTARSNQSAIAEQLAQIQDLDRRRHQLERELAEKRAELSREADVIRERIQGLARLAAAAAETDLAALGEAVEELQALETQRDESAKAIQKLKLRRSRLRAQLETLTTEGKALNERLGRLQLADGASCPLCGQALTASQRDAMLLQLEAERDEKRQQYRQCRDKIHDIGANSETRQREIDGWGLRLKDLPKLQRQFGAAAEQKRKAEEAAASLHLQRHHLAQIETRLQSADYGSELRRQLAQIAREREVIGYNPVSHDDIKTQLQSFAVFDKQHTLLEFARINLPEAEKIRADTAARQANLSQDLARAEDKIQRSESEITDLRVKVEQEREWRAKLERIRGAAQRLRESKTIREQELNAIAAGRARKKRRSARLTATQREQSLFRELRAAFGKNGVPAMIIETAIPELEAEANEILARMTDGRMALRFSTQRERASGVMAETLDIEIADELGARAYELYSGGEAFRINFAIRIALSKMLARRAGANLRALFIDEGFGSQDADGRDKLVEAINKIQADFDLILVITHIDELRDAFPAHLLVEKTAEGSIVSLQ